MEKNGGFLRFLPLEALYRKSALNFISKKTHTHTPQKRNKRSATNRLCGLKMKRFYNEKSSDPLPYARLPIHFHTNRLTFFHFVKNFQRFR